VCGFRDKVERRWLGHCRLVVDFNCTVVIASANLQNCTVLFISKCEKPEMFNFGNLMAIYSIEFL